MSEINTGGPAFTHRVFVGMNHDPSTGKNEPIYSDQPGAVTLRDYFAAKAIPAVYADYCAAARTIGFDEDWKMGVALDAYEMADAMIAAREKGGA